MEEVFAVTEPRSARSPRAEAMVDICRSRWELENRNAALESDLSEQSAISTELRERIHKMDYQQREFLKNLAKVVDDCDDILQVESPRLSSGDPDDPVIRQAHKWYRKVERTRQNLMERLNSYGVSTRSPAGMPSADLDTIHSTIETDAAAPGEIVKVLRPGLLWHGAVLRCSLVVVSAPAEALTPERAPPPRKKSK